MATIINFNPSPKVNFQFQATLDGKNYQCRINWNLFGQRYYFNVFTLRGVRVLTIPLIGSPVDHDISLTAGYFSTSVVYRVGKNQIEVA